MLIFFKLEQTPYLWGNQADDKLGIIDVRATINNKNPIDIEMQILNNQDIEKRILFLENPEGEEIKKMAEKEKEIKEAIETLEDISSDETKERIAELREKYIMDRASELETAEEKGIKQGARNEKEKVAKIMKQKNMQIDDIIDITGLTKEEIEKL